VAQAAGLRFPAETCLFGVLYLKMERTLVRFLHSGDPDVIQTCGLQVPGVINLPTYD
jgi:hypothetical protein